MPSLDPSKMKPRNRNRAAGAIHRVWGWIAATGAIGPQDRLGRRFARMGPRSIISFPPGAVLGEEWIAIGAETLIGPHVSMAVGMPGEPRDPAAPPAIVIGDRCSIGRGSSLVARVGIEIGDDVFTGPNVYVTDHNHGYADPTVPISRQWPQSEAVRIGSGCWLGTGAVVLPGADIGQNVVVAAGSVVRGHIPDRCVVAGAPAKVVRRWVDGTGWDPPLPGPPPGSETAPPDWG